MEHIVADSTFALQWVQKYRAEHSGDCPDDVREFAALTSIVLSAWALHVFKWLWARFNWFPSWL